MCLCVTTADCVPILLYDTKQKAIAAIHSGWRSTALNIVEATYQTMQKHYQSEAQDIVAAIGPCIGKDIYEVGKDVYNSFENKKHFQSQNNDKYLFDIRKTVAEQLQNIGITNIEISEYCTYSNPDLFFSARRQGIDSGRMLSGIMLK
jgi:YfiH family protein